MLRVLCPAKLNLFLAVGAPDGTGYHPVRTVMQAVSLFDELEIDFAGAGIEVEGADLPQDNTVARALRLSREVFALSKVGLRLTKKIPLEAGLGGGSSDAAGLLRALSWHRKAHIGAELHSIAAAVGMDTPFFLVGGRARAEHYGEIVSPLPDPPTEWYVITKPAVGCSSREMYARLDSGLREWREWPHGDELYNDFERIAPCESLDLIETMHSLGAKDAALSGSGSAVFGRFFDRQRAERAASRLGAQTWVCRSLSRSESLSLEKKPNFTA